MDALTFTVEGQPVPQPRPRISTWGGRGRAYTPKCHGINEFRQHVTLRATLAARAARWTATDAPVDLEVACTFRRPPSHLTKSVKGPARVRAGAPAFPVRADVDNLAKGILDAITDSGAVWVDDDQVVRLVVSKAYGAVAGVTVTVRKVPP